ncbi:type IX secretion system PorP/SprF family membrane protein [Pontibacter ummariensis]|uniref:Type IX secretion system membrane protein, PorP/SprF family n=1 Tax=Pontibacter ummariensis TaxID=1610492 RepID=A0A239K764_9BACT|nr:type IX secretion system membrane protein PorP/SprF [Pontibacter ummariensis]PRY06743.1 type IX secretion system PorP/SprF family membrane protein [Pontibacter ummariensis]SNT13473.1 type IX secretion system membrane protein, PorP/SprF family [Pontibacter ummariensis]
MRGLFCMALYFCCCATVFAQQRPQHTQYFQNNLLLNPAVAGIEDYLDVRSGFRSQWVGLEGAPTTFYTSVHTALNKNDRNVPQFGRKGTGRSAAAANRNNRFYVRPHHGLGAIALVDKSGLLSSLSFNLNYAYHLPLTANLNLSGGVSAGILRQRINRKGVDVLRPDDPFLTEETSNLNKLDLGLGLWLYSRDFYVGVSGMQLIKSIQDTGSDGRPRAELQPHYYTTAGIRFTVTDKLTISPSVMAKMAAGGLSAVDLNAKATYNKQFWLGASYRQHDAVAAMVGVYVNHFIDVSYSHDFTTSDLNRVSANSHEVVVGIKLNNPQKTVCPQWVW